MIILLILITSSHDNVWISLGENCCWSLLGLKGVKPTKKMLGQYLCVLTARFLAGNCDLFLLFTWCDSHQTVVVIHISIGSTHGRKNFWTNLWTDTFTDAINIVTMGIMVAFLRTARISYNTSKTSLLIWFRECASLDWIGGEENRARFSARLRIQLNHIKRPSSEYWQVAAWPHKSVSS